MAKKITTKKKKLIIAEYLECENMNAVARKFSVSPSTVKKILVEDLDGFAAKVTEKKTDVEQDILQHMAGQAEKVNMIIDKYLDALLDDEKIADASPNQLTTAMGTVIDKFLLAKGDLRGVAGGIVQIPAVLPEPEPDEQPVQEVSSDE